MKSIIKIYIQSFLFFSIIFFMYNLFVTDFNYKSFVLKTFFTSFLISSILLVIHLIFAYKSGLKNNFSPIQKLEIKNNTINILEISNILRKKSDWKLILQEQDFIILKTKPTFLKSFGEKIIISKNTDKLSIISKPSFPTTIFDFGKNYDNIKFIKQIILN